MTDSDDARGNVFQANNLEEVKDFLRSKGLAAAKINNVVPVESGLRSEKESLQALEVVADPIPVVEISDSFGVVGFEDADESNRLRRSVKLFDKKEDILKMAEKRVEVMSLEGFFKW